VRSGLAQVGGHWKNTKIIPKKRSVFHLSGNTQKTFLPALTHPQGGFSSGPGGGVGEGTPGAGFAINHPGTRTHPQGGLSLLRFSLN
jgi:hypothetical protein